MNEIQLQVKKSEWKNTEIWKAKGKAMDTNTGGSPGYQSPLNSIDTHVVRKWGDIGHQWALSPWSNGWMDGLPFLHKLSYKCFCIVGSHRFIVTLCTSFTHSFPLMLLDQGLCSSELQKEDNVKCRRIVQNNIVVVSWLSEIEIVPQASSTNYVFLMR